MKAKEKAKELVDKYIPLVYCYMGSGMLSNDYDENVSKDNAKKCALIAVDEILELDVCWFDKDIVKEYPKTYRNDQTKEFWEQVKNEINNL